MAKRRRFVINLNSGVIHDRKHLTESCNTDQIESKAYADTIGLRYFDFHRCKHCHVISNQDKE